MNINKKEDIIIKEVKEENINNIYNLYNNKGKEDILSKEVKEKVKKYNEITDNEIIEDIENINNKFINNIENIIKEEEIENKQKFLEELYDIYSNFYNNTQRVIRLLRENIQKISKTGLSDYILTLLESEGSMTYREITLSVLNNLDNTITKKSITDSLQYLSTKPYGIIRYYNKNKKRHEYKKR